MIATADDPRFWDRIARKYAQDKIADEGGYERTLARTRHHLSGAEQVFEFGCGTGTTALKLAPSVGRIVATDISGEMVTIAREKAAAARIGNVSFEAATLDDPRWQPGSFDAVLGFNALHLVRDMTDAVRQVRRILKTGGLFISKTPCLGDMNPLMRLAIPAMQLIGRAPYVTFFSGDELERQVRAAGFEIVEAGLHGSPGRKDVRRFIVARKL